MTDPKPLPLSSVALHELLESERLKAYDLGWDEGYAEGYRDCDADISNRYWGGGEQ
jgi:hypothetical protein